MLFPGPYKNQNLFFFAGNKPRPSKGTLMVIPLGGGTAESRGHAHIAPEWHAKIKNNKQNVLEVEVTPPAGKF